MSEGEESRAGRDAVWVEKYRPQTLEDIVGQEAITERLQQYVDKNDLQHMLFSGQAGIGKCATGDTPVLTNEGLFRMEDVVGSDDGFDVPPDGLEVLTYTESGEFEYVEPSHTYGSEADELVTVETRDGAGLTVTPEHRLLLATEGGLAWRPAEDVDEGDRVVRPLRAPLPETDTTLDWMDALDGDRTYVHVAEAFAERHDIRIEENEVGKRKRIVEGLRTGEDPSAIAEAANTTRNHVQAIERDVEDERLDRPGTVLPLGELGEIDASTSTIEDHVLGIQWVARSNNARSRVMTPPGELTPDLATFVGLAISEARIDGSRIKFYNTDEKLLDRFEDAARSLFDVETTRDTQHDVGYVEVCNTALTHYLESLFGVFGDGSDALGSAILRADVESRQAFLRAVFDAEGHVTDGGILELTQKDGDVITLLSYLLAGFGVPSRRKTKESAATNGSGSVAEYETLYISSASHLATFEDAVGFSVEPKRSRLSACVNRHGNPNHDTVPVQQAVDDLCDALYLDKSTYVPNSLNPETPGREQYLAAVDDLLEDASVRLGRVQEAMEEVSRLEDDLTALDRVPSVWSGNRAEMKPLETRREVATESGIGADRLLEYARGDRTPYANRAQELLTSIDAVPAAVDTAEVRSTIENCVESLDISYERLARGTDLRSHEVSRCLENEDHELASLVRFRSIASELEDALAEMASETVIEALSTLDLLVESDLYFDEVESVETATDSRRVYDLSVPRSRNYVAGAVPTVMHNTTAAMAIAGELYGEDWQEHFLELNASDERGIDVVRDRIKSFARTSFGGQDYRIIFLDEADALTSDAQSALRRTMEQFSNNVRFILSCNYSSQIIDPIQSRCAVFRFSPLADEAVAAQLRQIAENEELTVTDDGIDALVYAADGDMRRAINALQAASTIGDEIDEDAVFAITSTARPEEIQTMVQSALDGDFTAARAQLDDLLTDAGIAGGDIIDQLHRSVWEFDLEDEHAVRILDRVGETDYRITEGASERIQLEAMLASLARDE